MKRKVVTSIIGLLVVVLFIAACGAPAPTPIPPTAPPPTPIPPTLPPATNTPRPPTPTPAPTAAVFPVGTFDQKPYEAPFLGVPVVKRLAYTFRDDGSYTVLGNDFAYVPAGKTTVNGNQVTFVGALADGTCPEAGQYTWAVEGAAVTFRVIQDACADRVAGFAAPLTRRTETPATPVAIAKLRNLGTTKSLTILPLDEAAAVGSLKTEQRAVAYLIKTDASTVLLDVGANSKAEDPSPLLSNMQELGVKLSDINAIVISHNHFDHVGGISWQFKDTLSLGNQQVDLSGKRLYVPKPMTYPGLTPVVAELPMVIAPAVASIGTLPMTPPGFGPEQVLAVNVEGKGIVLITGCGHPTVPKIIERARLVFDEPIVGLVGGLHYPETDIKVLQPRADYIKGLNLQLVAVSPHDSTKEAIAAIQQTVPNIYKDIKVGQLIAFAP
jgi:7,8-dihydropterin-6-yl-methyl-4-(beta-D-ribofuranosyl)aminobenzene 5'-phosphate synthase